MMCQRYILPYRAHPPDKNQSSITHVLRKVCMHNTGLSPHIGSTVRDSISGLTGTLVWISKGSFSQFGFIQTSEGEAHAFINNLELIEARSVSVGVIEHRLVGSGNQSRGWGICSPSQAQMILPPAVTQPLQVAA